MRSPCLRSTQSRDPGPALSKGFRELAAGRNVVYTIRYIQNNLPYASRIETGGFNPGPRVTGGFSSQAPSGVYGVTFNEMRIRYTL